MFLDRVKISIKAGNGGKGSTSFLRNAMTAFGGPDGGEGGKGGDIVFEASAKINTLYNFQFKKKFVAENGQDGAKKLQTGANGKDEVIFVPCGTVIIDSQTNKIIADLYQDGMRFIALKGGRGGHGNAYYKSGNLPYAILNYERALKLNPSFEDARNNLEMANGFTVDRIEKVPDFILKTWVDNLGLSMSSDGWAVLFIVLFAASAVVFLIFFFVRAVRAGKAALFVTGTVLFVFSLISLSFSFARKADYMSEDYGIVVSAVSSVRSSPSDENTKSLFVLHEGTKVEILEVLGDWSKVEIADGRQGWMEGKDIETI